MPEEKDRETPKAPESAEAAEKQVADTDASVEAETPADPATGDGPETDDSPAAQRDAVLAGDEPEVEAAPAAKRGRRTGATVGIAHIRATFNNTQVAISDVRGGVISWSSAGRAGFKGSRKSTAFAATMVGQDAARQAVAKGMHEVEVHVQGAGSGRESAIRALQTSGLVVTLIKDVTPMPHNGCRQRKRRRV
jgi:small subunit ribosomal protein S11